MKKKSIYKVIPLIVVVLMLFLSSPAGSQSQSTSTQDQDYKEKAKAKRIRVQLKAEQMQKESTEYKSSGGPSSSLSGKSSGGSGGQTKKAERVNYPTQGIRPATPGEEPAYMDVPPQPGVVELHADPSPAEVYMGNKLLGKTPLVIADYPCALSLTLKSQGFRDTKIGITLTQGMNRKIEVYMEKIVE